MKLTRITDEEIENDVYEPKLVRGTPPEALLEYARNVATAQWFRDEAQIPAIEWDERERERERTAKWAEERGICPKLAGDTCPVDGTCLDCWNEALKSELPGDKINKEGE